MSVLHILKERSSDGVYRYSQGRVYLFVSVIFYFIMAALLAFKALNPEIQVDGSLFAQIMEAVQYPITTFAAYALGSKTVRAFMGKGGKSDNA